jgi:hypothetical protein
MRVNGLECATFDAYHSRYTFGFEIQNLVPNGQ